MNPSPHLPRPAADEQTREGPEHLQHAPITELQPSQQLANFRFRIVRMLGTGASGAVYLAYDATTQSEVALKVWHGRRLNEVGDDSIGRLGSEVRHARSIVHPNVCRVFDVTHADGLWFITMEYAKGGSLSALRGSAQALRPVAQRVADIQAVAEGLAAIHRAGIIHRDVKPENVLLMGDGRLVVSDFGVATPKQAKGEASSNGRAGTPTYMAPEVATQGITTTASDVWSFGMLSYELFFGRRPTFDPKTHTYEVPRLGRSASRLARQVVDLIAECLSEDPGRRPPDATLVAKRLAEIIEIDRARPSRRLALAVRRHGALGLALALLVASGVTAAFLARPPRAPAPRPATDFAALAAHAPDLAAGSRTIATWHERVDCLEVLPGGKQARVVLGKSRAALDVDLATGQTTPAVLEPVAKATACPRLSPDGKRLAYAVVEPLRPPRIFLSAHPDGSAGEELVQGKDPQWLPSGNELLYVAHTGGQPAVLVLPDVSRTLPVAVPPNARVLRMSVSERGDRIAILIKDGARTTAEIVAFPELTSLAREAAPPGAFGFRLDGSGTLQVGDGSTLFERSVAGRWSALGRLPTEGFVHLASAGGRHLALDDSTETTVFEQASGDAELPRARGRFGRVAVSPGGALLVQEMLPTGQSVISYQATAGSAREAVTRGPQDLTPSFDADERGFVYVDGAARAVRRCRLTGTRVCSTLFASASMPESPTLAPDGRHVLVQFQFGDSAVVQVWSVEGHVVKQLGISRCPGGWADPSSVWLFEAVARPEWIRVDATTANMLERRPADTLAGQAGDPTRAQRARCPAPPGGGPHPAAHVRTLRSSVVSLRFLP